MPESPEFQPIVFKDFVLELVPESTRQDPTSGSEPYAGLSDVVTKLESNRAAMYRLQAEEQHLLARASRIGLNAERTRSSAEASGVGYRSVQAAIGAVLRISDRTVAGWMSHADSLRSKYLHTLVLLELGKISNEHARVIVDEGFIIHDPRRRAMYEEKALEAAQRESVNRLRPLARRFAEQVEGCTINERHEEARGRRFIAVRPAVDGMADLIAHMPAAEALAIKDLLTNEAWQVRKVELHDHVDHTSAGAAKSKGGKRTFDQIRTDIFSDRLLRSDPTLSIAPQNKIQARVQVVVPVTTLINGSSGSASGVADLAGYGPIDPATARELAGNTPVWERVLVHPISGRVLEVDRYRPSEEMKRLLGARDQHCRFPGCRIPLRQCDIDHTVAWQDGGKTCCSNLAHLCRRHHTLKHHGGWFAEQASGGELHWLSPDGRTHIDRPVSTVMFKPVASEVTPANDKVESVHSVVGPRSLANSDPPF